eukprot:g3048.t1
MTAGALTHNVGDKDDEETLEKLSAAALREKLRQLRYESNEAINSLKQTLDSVTSESIENNKNLTARVWKMTVELSSFRNEKEKGVQMQRSLEKEVEKLEEKLVESKWQSDLALGDKDSEIEVLQERVTSLLQDLKNARASREDLQKRENEIQEKSQNVSKQFAELRRAAARTNLLEDQLKECRTKLKEKKEKLKSTKTSLEKATIELSKKTRLLQGAEAERNDLSTQVETLIDGREKRRQKLSSLKDELQEVKDELSSLQRETQMDALIEEKNTEIDTLQEEIRMKSEIINKLEIELTNVNSKLDDMENQMIEQQMSLKKSGRAQERFNANMDYLQKKLKRSESEKHDLEIAQSRKDNAIREREEKIESSRRSIEQLQQANELTKQILERRLKGVIDQSTRKVKMGVSENKVLQEKLDAALKELQTTIESHRIAEEALKENHRNELQENRKKFDEEKKVLQKQIEELIEKESHLKEENAAVEKKIKESMKKYEVEHGDKVATLTKEFAELQESRDKDVKELEQKIEEIEKKLLVEVKKNEAQVIGLEALRGERDTLRSALEKANKQVESMHDTRNDLDKERFQIKSSLDSNMAMMKETQGALNQVEAKYEKLVLEHKDATMDLKTTKENLGEKEKELKKVQEKLTNVEAKRDQLSEAVLISTSQCQQSEKEKAELLALQKQLQSQLEGYRREEDAFRKKQASLGNSEQKILQMSDENEDLQQRISSLEHQLVLKDSELEMVKEQVGSMEAGGATPAEVAVKNKEIKKLSQRLRDMDREKKDLKNKIAELQRDSANTDVLKQMLRSTTAQLQEKNKAMSKMKGLVAARAKIANAAKRKSTGKDTSLPFLKSKT